MVIVCPACSARFQYDDARFEGVDSKHFRCTKCANVFEFANPAGRESGAAPKTPRPQVGAPAPFAAQGRGGAHLVHLTGTKASMSLELTNPKTVIGRDDGDIATLDPEMSRRHAMIEIMEDGTAWLSDLGSRNGTFTQGTPVTGRTRLSDRQEFTCGKSAFMLRMS
jgi:predicted Zn finger-like uncharacterized protein